jgi:hypothetical protein
MLAQIPDDPVGRVLAAQNYIQEIKLIEEAMRRADGTEPPAPEPPAPGTAEPDPDGDSGAAPAAGGGDREGDGIGVTPTSKQAAAAASVAEDGDASIGERLRQKEEALKKEGASVPEARAGARCSTEVDVSDDEVKKSKGLFEIRPQMPKEMGHRETKQAGLLVSPVTKKRFEEIRQKHGDIDEVSESGIGCVELVDRMKAQLVPLDLEGLGIIRHHPDDIRDLSSNRDTRWGWGITARQTGNLELLLDLRYAISREGQEFRLIPDSPVYEGAIWVTPFQSDSLLPSRDRPWLWVSLIGVVVSTVIALVGLFLLWRIYKV